MITLKDANGDWVTLNDDCLSQLFTDLKTTIYGMTIEDLHNLRAIYLSKGCNFPITDVELERFNNDKQ